MSKLGKRMPSPRDRSAVVAKTDISRAITMPSDGKCLFAALSIGARVHPLPFPQRKAIGAMGRQGYLKLVMQMVDQKRKVLGLPIDSLLTDLDWTGVEEYFKGMEAPIASRRQWGGCVEAAILGHVWQMLVAFFLELLHGGNVAMMTEPVGTRMRGPLLTQTRRALALVLMTLQCDM